jgi:hypothetical protein
MQNQQLSDVKGKELVAAGHAFAKAMGMDTPLIDIAKMVAELATRLDCALVRGDAHMQAEMVWEKAMMAAIGEDGVGCVVRAIAELKAQRDALAAENAALKGFAETISEIRTDLIGGGHGSAHRSDMQAGRAVLDTVSDAFTDIKTPATDAYLNSVRAEGVESFAHQQRVIADATPAAAFQRHRRFAAGLAEDYAAQLRVGEPS